MKKSYLVTPLVAGALILPMALPATAAQASAPAPAAVSTMNKTALTTDQIKAEPVSYTHLTLPTTPYV